MIRVRESVCAAFLAVTGCGSSESTWSGETDVEGSSSATDEVVDFTPVCGNGRREEGEACDLGIGNEVGARCTSSCTEPVCGDGELAPWEECDDGNTEAGDGCSPACLSEGRPLWSVTADGEPLDEALWDLAAVGDGYVAVGTLSRSFYDTVPLVVAFGDGGEGVRWRETMESGPGAGVARRVLAVGADAVVAGTIVDDEEGPRAWMARFGPGGKLRFSSSLAIPGARAVKGMIEGPAGHALVIGEFEIPPAGQLRRTWVAEVDLDDGAVLWHAKLAADHEQWRVDDIAPVEDGWVIGGRSAGTKWVVRYDDAWNVSWERSWERDNDPFHLSVAGAPDGRLIVAGGLPIPEPVTTYDYQRWVVALEPDGSVAWEVIEPVLPGGWDHVTDVEVDELGGVWVTGQVKTQPLMASASWDVDAWIQRLDRDGSPTITYTFDGRLHGHDQGLALLVTAPDSVVVAGSSSVLFENGNPWVARFGPGDRPPKPRAPRPAEVARTDHVRSDAVHRASLYIDFDGRELRPGNWGTHGEVPCLGEAVAFPGFLGRRADAEGIVERVERLLSPYGIAVHWKRRPPAQLPYTTVVVGGVPEQLGLDERMKGFSCVTDCGDRWSRDLAFAFGGDAGPHTIAMNIVHEAAHTWGLDHELGVPTVMQPFVGPGNTWSTACVPVSEATSMPTCDDTNREFCPSGQQNSDAVLRAMFGTSEVDDVPPTIEIHSPATGSVHRLGDPVIVEIDVADDRGNPGFRVVVDALDWSRIAVGSETRFELALPVGTFEIRVEAVDHGGNETRRSVEVDVRP